MSATVAVVSCAVVVLQSASAERHVSASVDAGRIAQVPNEERAEEAQRERSRIVPTDWDFDRWVFGESIGGGDPMSPDMAQHRRDYLLETAMIYIDQLCGLSEEQMTKLRLAG
jgi:hypothetical protein